MGQRKLFIMLLSGVAICLAGALAGLTAYIAIEEGGVSLFNIQKKVEPVAALPNESVNQDKSGEVTFIGSFLEIDSSSVWISVNGKTYKVSLGEKTIFVQRPANLALETGNPGWAKKITPVNRDELRRGMRVVVRTLGENGETGPAIYVMRVI